MCLSLLNTEFNDVFLLYGGVLNGVPSPPASTRTHIWLKSLDLSPKVQLWAAKVVAVDVVDITGDRKGTIW